MGGLRGLRRIPQDVFMGRDSALLVPQAFWGQGLLKVVWGCGVEDVSPQDSVSLPVCQLLQ